jgi:ribonuclease Z
MNRVIVLGAGVPTPTVERWGTAYLFEIGDERLLMDCGPAGTYKLVQAGFAPTQIDHLFFTHHHFDHNADYPCFLICRWEQSIGDERELQVFGPAPTATITDRILNEDYGASSATTGRRASARRSASACSRTATGRCHGRGRR